MTDFTTLELQAELSAAAAALAQLGDRQARLWELLRISPSKWNQRQYEGTEGVWVVALMGSRCLYFNPVESGWGWGRFTSWGVIHGYHWQQDEIQHAIGQALCALDTGGMGLLSKDTS